MSSKFLLAPVAVAAALCFGAVSAQTTTTAPAGAGTTSSGSTAAGTTAPRAAASDKSMADKSAKKDDKLARGDRKFIEESLAHGQFEIQAGQLAATKATDPAIKSFGEQMVKDHTAASQSLQQIASKHQIEPAKELPRAQRNKLQDLQKKTGADFDKEFVKEVAMEAHEDDVKKFTKASKDVKDPELKAWVDKTLPTIQQHHASAMKLPHGKNDSARMGNTANRDKAAAPATTAPKTGS
jgi:putative membrane protein